MSNNLKNIETAYYPNTRVCEHRRRLKQKRYNNYNRMPEMITNNKGYYWDNGFNKRYGRYTHLIESGLLTGQLEDFTLKLNRELRMSDFFYDNVSKKDLKLIRQRFKKGPINLKGYHQIAKAYSYPNHRYTFIHIAWVLNDTYIINDVTDFVELLKQRAL